MIKVSRPVVYSALGALTIYAVFLNTQPDTPATVHKRHIVKIADSSPSSEYTTQDQDAKFSSYRPKGRDAFAPVVRIFSSGGAIAAQPVAQVDWSLTAINSINGKPSAVVEEPRTGETAYLSLGDNWKGLHVVGIGDDRLVLENALHQRTNLAFVQTDPTVTTFAQSEAIRPLPVGNAAIRPLPPMSFSPSPFVAQGR